MHVFDLHNVCSDIFIKLHVLKISHTKAGTREHKHSGGFNDGQRSMFGVGEAKGVGHRIKAKHLILPSNTHAQDTHRHFLPL